MPKRSVPTTGFWGATTTGIQPLLLASSFRSLAIAIDAVPGSLPVVMLPAAKGAANIPSSGILGFHKKRDLAMSAAHHVSLPFGFSFQQGIQFETILLDDRLGAILLVPIRPKGKNLPEGDRKKARFSVRIRMLVTASSYRIQGKPWRGRARFFRGIAKNSIPAARASGKSRGFSASCAPDHHSAAHPTKSYYLEDKKPFSFQVAGQFT